MKNAFKEIYITLLVLITSQFTYAVDSKLEFENVPLSDVLNELGEFYSINFIYQDELIKGKQVTGNLNNQNSDLAIQEIQIISNLSVEKINENTYVLYRKSRDLVSQNKKRTSGIEGLKTPILIPPKAISNLKIPYPELAKIGGFEGSVDIKILINENGDVQMVRIQKSSNSTILDQAAIEYAKKIKFVPAYKDSQSIAVWSKWKIVFDLIPSDTSYSEVFIENIKE